jgi:hypothetical protein
VPRLAIVPGRTDNAAKALGLGLATASCDYVLPLPRDAMLAPDALYRLAKALVESPGARDLWRRGQDLAPGAPQQAMVQAALEPRSVPGAGLSSGACLVQRQAALNVPASPALAGAGLDGMLLAITRDPDAQVVHVPHVLCHHATPAGQTAADAVAQEVRVAAVAQVLADEGARRRPALRFRGGGMAPARRSAAGFHHHPHARRVGLVRTAVSGVLTATRYRNIEC